MRYQMSDTVYIADSSVGRITFIFICTMESKSFLNTAIGDKEIENTGKIAELVRRMQKNVQGKLLTQPKKVFWIILNILWGFDGIIIDKQNESMKNIGSIGRGKQKFYTLRQWEFKNIRIEKGEKNGKK